jgi:hypothetical protein
MREYDHTIRFKRRLQWYMMANKENIYIKTKIWVILNSRSINWIGWKTAEGIILT